MSVLLCFCVAFGFILTMCKISQNSIPFRNPCMFTSKSKRSLFSSQTNTFRSKKKKKRRGRVIGNITLTWANCDIYSLGYFFMQTIQNEVIPKMDGICSFPVCRYGWMAFREEEGIHPGCSKTLLWVTNTPPTLTLFRSCPWGWWLSITTSSSPHW